MANEAKSITYRITSIVLVIVFLLSVLIIGTYGWNNYKNHKTNESEGMPITAQVILQKQEKTMSGEETDTIIPGAEFYMYKVSDPDDTQIGGRYVTDQNGQIRVQGLRSGRYYFIETLPGSNYIFDKDGSNNAITRYDFEINGLEQNNRRVVTAWNRRLEGPLTISKIVKNSGGEVLSAAQQAESFEFTVTFSEDGEYTYRIDGGSAATISSGGILYLKHGQTAIFENMPLGMQYSVKETDDHGYYVQSDNHQGHITENSRNAVFTNTRYKNTSRLIVTKSVSGTGAEKDKEFEFTIKIGGIPETFVLKDGQSKVFDDIPVGTEYEVTEKDYTASGYTSSPETYTGQTVNGSITLPFVNRKDDGTNNPGSLKITKRVIGTDADTTKRFLFTVTFNNLPSGTSTIDVNGQEQELSPANRVFTIRLKHEESAIIKNIPKGVKYVVEETQDPDYTAAVSRADGTITSNHTADLTFTNDHKGDKDDEFGRLIVKKTVNGPDTDKTKEFEFTMTIGGKSETFTLKDGEIKTFSDIPVGTIYSVVENDYKPEGYISSPEKYSGAVIRGSLTLPFVNSKDDETGEPGSLQLTKRVIGDNIDASKKFTFTVTFDNLPASAAAIDINGVSHTLSSSNRVFTVRLSRNESVIFGNLPNGVKYTVKETAEQGYTAAVTESEGVITSNQPSELTFVNDSGGTTGRLASLIIEKTVSGTGADKTKEFEFTVTIGGVTEIITLKDGQSKEYDNIPVGTEYTVTEKDYTTAGYVSSPETYTGHAVTGSLTLPFVNEKDDGTGDPGALKVTKRVTGKNADINRKFGFTVTFGNLPAGTSTISMNGITEELSSSNRVFTVRLKHNEGVLFENLPAGVKYIVEETPDPEYTAAVTQSDGTIASNHTVELSFVNDHKGGGDDGRFGQLIIEKSVSGTGADKTKDFEFTVTIGGVTEKIMLKDGQNKVYPNIPVGTLYTVTEKDYTAAGYVSSPGSYTGNVIHGSLTLPFDNHKDDGTGEPGSLQITKRVVGLNADINRKFTFTVTFANLPNSSVNININGQTHVLSPANRIFTVMLKHGETAVLRNLPDGITYLVTEMPDPEYISAVTKADGEITSNHTVDLIFTNDRGGSGGQTGRIVVKKSVTGPGADKTKEFEFTMTIGGVDETFTLRDGQSKTFYDIPVGTPYEVIEKDYKTSGYVSSPEIYTGYVIAGSVTLPFNNHKDDGTGAPGSLQITKHVVGTNADVNKRFTFTVTFDNLPASPATINVNGATQTLSSSNRVFTVNLKHGESAVISNLPAGVTYTAEETPEPEYTPAVTSAGGTIASNHTSSVLFVNDHAGSDTKSGSIVVRKTVSGTGADKQKDFEFTVTIGGITETFTLKDGHSRTFDYLPAGTAYTVVEKDYRQEGYVSSPGSYTGKTINGTITLPFNNHKDDGTGAPGSLKITKRVVGNNIDANKRFTFTVTFDNLPGGTTSISVNGAQHVLSAANRVFTVTLKQNENAVIHGLPSGITYTVTETAEPGYTAAIVTAEGIIVSNHTSELTFINDGGDHEIQLTNLVVTKRVTGTGSDANMDFEFAVTIGGISETFTLKDGEIKTFYNLPVGTAYTVTERDYTSAGYVSSPGSYTGTVINGGVTLPFVNNKDDGTGEPGGLKITKRVIGEKADVNKRFVFTVTFGNVSTSASIKINGTTHSLTSSNNVFTVNLKHNESAVFENVPKGVTYAVAETQDPEYTADITRWDGVISSNHTVETIVVNDSGGNEIRFGKLVIEKLVIGEITAQELNRKFAFTLEVEGREPELFELRGGESIEIIGLPVGAKYSIYEANVMPVGYALTGVTNGSGTVKAQAVIARFTNTFEGTVVITAGGEKTWDLKGHSPVLPESVTVALKNGDVVVDTAVVRPDESTGKWTYSFTAPKYAADGVTPVVYTVSETAVEQYYPVYSGNSLNIVNVYIPPVITDSVRVKKTIASERTPVETFEFIMTANDNAPMPDGSSAVKTITVTGAGEADFGAVTYTRPGIYTYTVTELNSGADGWAYDTTVYTYTVEIEEQSGAMTVKSRTLVKADTPVDIAEFVNRYDADRVPDKVEIIGEKTWDHGTLDPKYHPKSITVLVKVDGATVAQHLVTADQHWTWIFRLPKYDGQGNEIVYTIDEVKEPGYTKVIDGYDIKNTYDPGDPDTHDGPLPGDSDDPKTGNDISAMVWLMMILVIVSTLSMIVLFAIRPKKRQTR